MLNRDQVLFTIIFLSSITVNHKGTSRWMDEWTYRIFRKKDTRISLPWWFLLLQNKIGICIKKTYCTQLSPLYICIMTDKQHLKGVLCLCNYSKCINRVWQKARKIWSWCMKKENRGQIMVKVPNFPTLGLSLSCLLQ